MAYCCNPLAAAAAVSRMAVVVVKYRFLRGLLIRIECSMRLHSDSLKTSAKTIPAAECASPRAAAPYCCRRVLAVVSAGKGRQGVHSLMIMAMHVCTSVWHGAGAGHKVVFGFPFTVTALMPFPQTFSSFPSFFQELDRRERTATKHMLTPLSGMNSKEPLAPVTARRPCAAAVF